MLDIDDLIDYALDDAPTVIPIENLSILDKEQSVVPLQLNRVQKHLAEHITGRDLVLKSRQQGVSTYIQARHFQIATSRTARIGTLAHDDQTTQKLRDMQQLFYNALSEEQKPPRSSNNATRTSYSRTNSIVYIATAGNSKGGRGGTYSHVHGSEVAFWTDAAGILKGLLQGVPLDGEIILESTPNGAIGWFYEQCMAALDGNSIWKMHFYEWWWEDEYRISLAPGEVLNYSDDEQALVDKHGLDAEQIKWRRYKIKELGPDFIQEYPEDPRTCFLTSGNSYFGNVEHVFKPPRLVDPIPNRRYVAGLDFGQTVDYTVLAVFDAVEYKMVDLIRMNRLLWQEMRRRISITANKWNAEVWGESNSMGRTNIELLQTGEILPDGTVIAPIRLQPFDTTPQSKPPLIQGLYHALHEMGMELWSEPLNATVEETNIVKTEFRGFISRQTANGHWVYEAGEDIHDDIVIGCALAWHGINGQMGFGVMTAPAALSDYFLGN